MHGRALANVDTTHLLARYVQRWREQHGRFGGLMARLRLHAYLARHESMFVWPVYGNAHVLLREGRLRLGRDVLVSQGASIIGHPGATISLGERVFLGRNVSIAAIDHVRVGEQSAFGPGCFVADHDHDWSDEDVDYGESGQLRSRGPVVVGHHVWCGANVVVTSGVTIGDGCVIGANSVVTRDVPPYSLAAGAPARVLRSLDPGHADPATLTA